MIMAKARKKSVTSKNTVKKPVDNSMLNQLKRTYEYMGDKRIWGILFSLETNKLDKPLNCPTIISYDGIYDSIDHDKIKEVGKAGIIHNMFKYFHHAIQDAGDEFTSNIEEYMRRQHNILIGERSAERVKIEVGAAMTEIDNPPPDYAVHGRDLMTGIPKEIYV